MKVKIVRNKLRMLEDRDREDKSNALLSIYVSLQYNKSPIYRTLVSNWMIKDIKGSTH
jgi:hypothetical protein